MGRGERETWTRREGGGGGINREREERREGEERKAKTEPEGRLLAKAALPRYSSRKGGGDGGPFLTWPLSWGMSGWGDLGEYSHCPRGGCLPSLTRRASGYGASQGLFLIPPVPAFN